MCMQFTFKLHGLLVAGISFPFNSLHFKLENDKCLEMLANASDSVLVIVRSSSFQTNSSASLCYQKLAWNTGVWGQGRLRGARGRRSPFDIVIIYSLFQHLNPQRSGVSSTPLKCISASVSSSGPQWLVDFHETDVGGCVRFLVKGKTRIQHDNTSTCNLWHITECDFTFLTLQ